MIIKINGKIFNTFLYTLNEEGREGNDVQYKTKAKQTQQTSPLILKCRAFTIKSRIDEHAKFLLLDL